MNFSQRSIYSECRSFIQSNIEVIKADITKCLHMEQIDPLEPLIVQIKPPKLARAVSDYEVGLNFI
jgi:hypothetical protein